MTAKRLQPPAAPRSQQRRPGPPHAPSRRRPAIDRFLFTYLYRELRARLRQALLIALGLGLGVGLVVTVAAVSVGVGNAQGDVLHSLYGIGTDLTVTSPASEGANNPGGGGGGPSPDTLHPGNLGLFPSTWVTRISGLAHVTSAAGGLDLMELTQPAGVPQALSVDGVDVTRRKLGPLASGTLASGRDFSETDGPANVAILDTDYAAANKLSVGSTITLDGAGFHVIGIMNRAEGGAAADIYIPLARAQALAQSAAGSSLIGQVNEIYVAAAASTDVPAVQAEIAGLFPRVAVTSAGDLASQVSGSLASTARLTNDLGTWVAAAALVAAFAAAGLLTTAAVNRRIRELGTLKALGWSTGRVVIGVMSESAVIGVLGALLGIAIGFAGAAVVAAVAPQLSAVVPPGIGSGDSTIVPVHLVPAVSATAVVTAVLLAVAGALVAGAVGAWRAGRLRPADAFAQIT